MFCTTSHRIKNNLSFLCLLRIQLDNICFQNMSFEVNTSQEDINDTLKTQKRQIADGNDEIAIKAQKVEAPKEETEKAIQKVKRKNFVIMLGYMGKDYFGMQRNPARKTIEQDLFTALLKCDFITKEQFEDIHEVRFQRAARTDKGVSAVRQVVSLKLPCEVSKTEVNKHLPKEIRVFDIRRVTRGFNSKNKCDGRTYRYVIPTFAFAPENPNSLIDEEEDDDTYAEKRLEQLSVIDGKPYKEFRITPDMLDKLSETLKLFEGSHNFHNFTSKVLPLDPRARRYMVYFRCIETFIANDMEFAVLEIKGQSFMLHQIRKMMSLVIGICKNITPNDILNKIFTPDRIDIPIAPGLGLSLHHVHYTNYNSRYGNDGFHETLDWTEYDEEVQQFYKDYILKHIVDTETSEQTTLNCLARYITPRRFLSREDEFVATVNDIE